MDSQLVRLATELKTGKAILQEWKHASFLKQNLL